MENAEGYLCICILIDSILLRCSVIDVGNAMQKWGERITLLSATLV